MAEVIGESALRDALRQGVLVQPWRGVIMSGDSALDPVSRAAAGLLAAGPEAVLSHETAAAIHGCTAANGTDVHVTLPYSTWVRSKNGLVVHHGRFADDDVELRHGLRVLCLYSAITELLCTMTRWRALACLDEALAGLSDQDVGRFIGEVDGRLLRRVDRKGVRRAESLLCLGTNKSESPQESRLRLFVIDAGFPRPVAQYEVRSMTGGQWYVLDLAWPDVRIALEYDGFEAHEERAGYDEDRDSRLAGRGWLVIRVRKHDFDRPEALLERLRCAFATRGLRIAT